MKKDYQKSINEILEELNTSSTGLSHDEAKLRLEKNGKNKLVEPKSRPLFLKFLDQFKDFMVLVLIGAALIAFLVGVVQNSNQELIEGSLILAIIIINAILGLMQEAKAEKALESIKQLSAPHVKVLRNKKPVIIEVEDLVVGDVVILQAGDYMPADLRIIESINLKVDESALTGESVPVDKTSQEIDRDEVALGDQLNLGFMSTVVSYGRGKAVVIKTGMDTEIGKIASMLITGETELTPLQKTISQLGKLLAIIALAIVSVIFVIQIVKGMFEGEILWLEAFMSSVALAVAAIPEGLPAIITIVLALGMQNLVKEKAIMRTLPSVETLGSTSIICSDKTGTLTQNVMTITKTYLYKEEILIPTDKEKSSNLEKLMKYGLLCNDTSVELSSNNTYIKLGEPTEMALTNLAINEGIDPILALDQYPRVFEFPFDSERKLMTTVHKIDNKYISITKGAPDVLIKRVTLIDNNGTLIDANENNLKEFKSNNEKFTNEALRVLAVSYKVLDLDTDLKKLKQSDLEQNLIFLGLVGMIDPPRPEVKDAIKQTKKAGIITIMITGDHKNTAVAIAKDLGILENGHLAITNQELDKMEDEEFFAKLQQIRVYARISPTNKVRIVNAWKSSGHVVAMTGDGVNDAPSIKRADIGIAMGITGTEVAKGASDMILTDDNFATIVNAVSEGRKIFANIKKSIHFLLSCNIGEIVTIFLGVTVGIFLFSEVTGLQIITASQILWVNLVTDSFMAIALGLEPKEPDIMDYPPRSSKKSIFSDGLGFKILWQGLMIGSFTFLAFFFGYHLGLANYSNLTGKALQDAATRHAQTLAFMVLATSQLFHAFNVRSDHYSVFSLKPNKYLNYAFIGCLVLQFITVLIPTIANFIFGIDSIYSWGLLDWLVVVSFSVLPLIVVEIVKFINKRKLKTI